MNKEIEKYVVHIKNKIGNRIHFVKWFDEMYKLADIELFTNIKKDHWYYNYLSNYNIDPSQIRGMAFNPINSYYFITIHNQNNETFDSICWIIIHELGHIYCEMVSRKLGYDLFEDLSGGALEDMTQQEYEKYVKDDKTHEARYEEQFVNNIANTIMGECYDRYWWRKN